MAFSYDGKSMTLLCKPTNTYGTVPAPANLDTAMDTVRKKYRLDDKGNFVLAE